MEFEVWLGDRSIGQHLFQIDERADQTLVTSSLDLGVKLLFATLFKYEHRAIETWQGGCLLEINSTTKDNGERFALEGQASGEGFLVAIENGDNRVVDRHEQRCIGSYAYWDRNRLKLSSLINSQTGEINEVQLTYLGSTPIPRHTTEGETYSLATDKALITLWYSQTGTWLALKTSARKRTLTYVNTAIGS